MPPPVHNHLTTTTTLLFQFSIWRCRHPVLPRRRRSRRRRFQFSIGDAPGPSRRTNRAWLGFQFSIGDARQGTAELLRKVEELMFQFSIGDAPGPLTRGPCSNTPSRFNSLLEMPTGCGQSTAHRRLECFNSLLEMPKSKNGMDSFIRR